MKLTKRKYLGVGYIHRFQNDKTGEILNVPCTKEEYERMGEVGGEKYNPTKEGFTWLCSVGGTIKCDNEDTVLKENEYCQINDKYFLSINDKEGFRREKSVSLDKISSDEISEINLTKIWQYI